MLKVEPVNSLYNQSSEVSVKGLNKGQNVTITGELRIDGHLYRSCGQYIVDSTGCVDMVFDLSLGGTYTGIQPMGWLWGLMKTPGSSAWPNLWRDTTISHKISVDVWEGHIGQQSDFPTEKHITGLVCQRGFMGPGVSRVPVHTGKVRGNLFLPKGQFVV